MAMVLESCSTDEVCKALGGNDELLADLRSKLKDWLLHQPHLPQDMPEQRLEHFVISTKHSLELAKQKLDMYYTVRRLVPELFAERDPQAQYVTRLNESLYTFMVGDIRISECRSLGDIYIYDLSAMRVGHLAKLTPAILKKAEVAATKAYGARIKGIHFINAPNFIDRIVTLVKSAIKPKLASRVHVHSSGLDSLYEHVPKSVLPSDYGGEQASMNELDEKWRGKLADWRDWFLKEEVLNANEDLRPGPQLDVDDLFGFQGSFRKLEVD
ncbi:unnamed protein product [Trichogramma brassicae]|uniref:CRAL-TRIO domain-containing protein n=1 Tax=Trichogramma brassicae TaxID=86971 RepID=A0A6H5I3L5_9HYME|nr:unnamed protein product [Trichogramma brassicae]